MAQAPATEVKKRKKGRNPLVRPWVPYAFVAPMVVVILFIVVIPLIFGFMLSAYDIKLNNIRLLGKIGVNIFKLPAVLGKSFVGLGNYIEIFKDPTFWEVFLRTVVWTVLNVSLHVILGVFLAVMIHRKLPGKKIFRVLIILPWAIPQYIAVITWRNMFYPEYGMINLILKKLSFLGSAQFDIANNPLQYFIACIVTNVWLGVPFMMMVASGGLQSIPSDIYEAADIDGANPWQKFWSITVPMLKPVMTPAIMLGSVWTFNMINIIYLMDATGRPSDKVNILIVKLYRDGFDLYRYGYAAAMAVVIFVILAIFAGIYMKVTRAAED